MKILLDMNLVATRATAWSARQRGKPSDTMASVRLDIWRSLLLEREHLLHSQVQRIGHRL